jgi:hypothetical protein
VINPWALTFLYEGEAMTTEYEAAEALKMRDQTKAKEFGWKSNNDDENPGNLPWPEENESKE